MADKLTPQQAQAVWDRGGKLLVSAAAGSGKTKVLVDRLLGYVMDEKAPCNLDEFLIITYTKAAAAELRGKIAAKLTERIAEDPGNRQLQKQVQRLFLTTISTVHGFCSDLLKEYAYRLDLPADFRVADENECRELQQGVLEELLDSAYENQAQDGDFRAFVDSQGMGRDDRLVPELILKVYQAARCHLDPEKWLDMCVATQDCEEHSDVGKTLWGGYLMEDFHSFLESQIRVFTQCVLDADGVEGFEKAALNLKDTLYSLQQLQQAETWDQIHEKRKVDFGRLTFPRKNPDPELAQRIKAARAACKDGLAAKGKNFSDSSEQILTDLQQCSGAARGLIRLVRQFSLQYEKAKRSRRVLDFGDLEHETLNLLLGRSRSGPTQAAGEIGRRFREIMVDEYQDSNGVQDAIFSALSQSQNLFMVGDVKQSIYQFRLADPGIFLQKYQQYVNAKNAQPGQGRKVMLNANFRSGPEVIEAVNAVFEACMSPKVGGLHYGEDEKLREGIPHGLLPDPAVELYAMETEEDSHREEAAFAAARIGEMLREKTLIRQGEGFRPVEPQDIVILLRSPGSTGSYYEKALGDLGIRCVSGGGNDLLRTQEVTALRSLLQTISNPRQDIPLLSTLMGPVFSFTADDLAEIRGAHKKGTIYEALLEDQRPETLAFLGSLQRLRDLARHSTLTQLLEGCLTETRMDSIFGAMEAGELKKTNLQAFFQLAADYENGGIRDLNQFLDHLEALEDKGMAAAGEAPGGAVTIMSIHKSKGLEFPVVLLCGLARKFNQESMRQQIFCDRDLGLGLSVADGELRIRYPSIAKSAIGVKMAAESLSEEMRVLYVAMTRARDRLIMTYARNNLQKNLEELSQRMDFDGGRQLAADAMCPGQWVMMTALGRCEAGELHSFGGRPMETRVTELPWKIRLVQSQQESQAMEEVSHEPERDLDCDQEQILRQALAFRYAHLAATQAPSKQTATGRKGRERDAEAAEDTKEKEIRQRTWREPVFGKLKKEGKTYGTAVHGAMQYLDFSRCGSLEGIQEELLRIRQAGFLSEDQANMVSARKISPFFDSEIGKKLVSGTECIREFKFSILDGGEKYGEGLQGEQVLLQGVVDCALLEEDGITVLDFKTDFVTEETLEQVTDRYRIQLATYADALSRIYEQRVKASYLYFFHLNRFVRL